MLTFVTDGRRDDDVDGTCKASPADPADAPAGPSRLPPKVGCRGPLRPADGGGDPKSGPLHRLGDRDKLPPRNSFSDFSDYFLGYRPLFVALARD